MSQIAIENVIRPGSTYSVDAVKYETMRKAYLSVLPSAAPGLTPAELLMRLSGKLPQDVFPGGAKAGWWAKAVQLDLEAKAIVKRAPGSPVRLYRV